MAGESVKRRIHCNPVFHTAYQGNVLIRTAKKEAATAVANPISFARLAWLFAVCAIISVYSPVVITQGLIERAKNVGEIQKIY